MKVTITLTEEQIQHVIDAVAIKIPKTTEQLVLTPVVHKKDPLREKVLAGLSGNKYEPAYLLGRKYGFFAVLEVLEVLEKEGLVRREVKKGITKWKRVSKKPVRSARFSWIDIIIIRTLDATNQRMTTGDLEKEIIRRYPEHAKRPADIHNSVGSALGRLKEKPHKRFRYEKRGRNCVYWTV